jgi:hypothetical protein
MVGAGGVKTLAIFGHKEVAAVHGAGGCAQARAAGVLKRLTGLQQGLLADHAQAAHTLGVAGGVVDVPLAGNQLRGDLARIGDGDGVREGEDALLGGGLIRQIAGQDFGENLILGHGAIVTAKIRRSGSAVHLSFTPAWE